MDAVPAREADRPDVPIRSMDMAAVLTEAISRLPFPDQRIIKLRYFLECDGEAIALQFGVAESTISKHHARALVKLRGILRAMGILSFHDF
jgi:RNA polymerase sigma factor (sigma-70 family)